VKTPKDKLNEDIDRHIQTHEMIRAVVNALPDELPVHAYFHVGMWAVYIDIPYDWDIYKELRRALGGEWHSSSVHNQDVSGDKFYILRLDGKRGYNLYISLQPGRVGSSCRLEKVGERVTDIFQAVCD
jgi:hypothetical protein